MTKIHEIEVGPHFITIYGEPRRDMVINIPRKMYKTILKKRPDIAKIQQKNLSHEPGDIPVYHPYGKPENFREIYYHFHIRYEYEPTLVELNEVVGMLEEHGCEFSENYVVNSLNWNSLPEYEHYAYPPQKQIEKYEAYIKRLKLGAKNV